MNVADKDTGTIFALANAGLAIGALGFGLAVDIIGRKWAFNLTCLITSIFGLLLVCPQLLKLYILCSQKPGRSQVQLRRHLRHLLPGLDRSWR
jgi:MFS family permease